MSMVEAVMGAGAGRISFGVRPLVEAVRRWAAYRDTSGDLSKLSRKELMDIGVEASADEFAWTIANDSPRR